MVYSDEGKLQDAVQHESGRGDRRGGERDERHVAGGRVSRKGRHTTNSYRECVRILAEKRQNVRIRLPGNEVRALQRHSERR